jgi:hypothetical protein
VKKKATKKTAVKTKAKPEPVVTEPKPEPASVPAAAPVLPVQTQGVEHC